MSRRLAISSLLCEDDPNEKPEPTIVPEPVLLAPHLRRPVDTVSPRSSSQPTASSGSPRSGLDALVHAADVVEERSRLPASWSPPEDTSVISYGQEHLQRHHQQLEKRLVHREQILGYNDDPHRPGRKSDPLPGPGMRNIMGPSIPSTPAYHSVSPTSHTAPRFPTQVDDHLHKKRRYSDEREDYDRLRQQQDDADHYRQQVPERVPSRSSISAITSPTVTSSPPPTSRRTGYDPVHENDRYNNTRYWDRNNHQTHRTIDQVDEESTTSAKRGRNDLSPYLRPTQSQSQSPYQEHHYAYSTSAASSRSPHFQHHDQETPFHRDSHAPYPLQPSHLRDLPPAQHPQQQHRVISPVGRRSPPGSQAGRAIAAKKVEHEHQMSSMDSIFAQSATSEVKREIQEPPKKKERKSSRSDVGPSPVKPEISTPLPPSSLPAPVRREDDPHEWLLEQYADDNDRRKIQRPHSTTSAPSSAAAVMPPVASPKSDPGRRSTVSPIASKSPPVPSRDIDKDGDDAMMALEQELDAELADVVDRKPPAPASFADDAFADGAMNVDVDQAVAELVDETLGNGTEAAPSPARQVLDEAVADVDMTRDEDQAVGHRENEEDKAMDVDVEDELLSLLDGRPNSRMSGSAQNTPAPSTVQPETTKVNTKGSKNKAPPVSKLKIEETEGSRPVSPLRPPSASSVRQSSVKPSEKDDRESMPPPSTTPKPEAMATAAQPKKRGKPGPKPKPRNPDGTIVGAPPPKPRGKPGPKPKPRDEFGNIIRTSVPTAPPSAAASTSRATSSSATPAPPIPPPQLSRTASGSHGARSRSTSALPAGPEVDKEEEKEEEKEVEDDKLYCLCKTKYDEERPMIECDSCDDWYHMKCVDIPEHKGDLVDQFICPLCIEKNPSSRLKTTYKQRCLFGLNSPDPDSPKSCHKPARTFSKYCSEECGVKTLRKRIDTYTKKGGKKEDLWDSVKTASKREGLVRVIEPPPTMQVDGPGEGDVFNNLKPIVKEIKPSQTKQEREIERLNGLLADIEKVRDELRRGMDVILWREKLVQLASDRSESLGQCGWDQRLCFSDQDWADFGEGVFESYAEQVEGSNNGEIAEYWCPGDQDCERHAGWQNLRAKDVDKEKEKKEEALFKLNSKEREIRKRIDRIEEQEAGPLLGNAPRKAAPKGGNKMSNGHITAKAKVNGDASKKGKKRKAPL